MINIHIITLGKLKETYWREAETEYLKRLGPYAKIQIHELREESFTEKDQLEIIKQKEAKKINEALQKIKPDFIFVLDEHGTQFSSKEFAEKINNLTNQQFNNLVFIIGGPLGLEETILKMANLKISFSKMTFTHQMIRIFLLEQIYRAEMILNNRKYHY